MADIKTKDLFGKNATKKDKSSIKPITSNSKVLDTIDIFLDYLYKARRMDGELAEYINTNVAPVYRTPGFRHSYFRISAKIQEIRSRAAESEISYLEANLETVKRMIDSNKFQDINIQLGKFYDHCTLEISRYKYFDSIFWKNDSAKEQIEDNLKHIQNLRNEVATLKKEVADSKAEHITILSIFAAIMLSSIGGFNVVGHLMASLAATSIYRIIFILCLAGIVLFNTMCVLLYLIARITNRQISIICPDGNKTGDCIHNNCSEDCWVYNKIRKRFPYVFAFNTLMLGIMLADIFLWRFFRGWLSLTNF